MGCYTVYKMDAAFVKEFYLQSPIILFDNLQCKSHRTYGLLMLVT